MEVLYYEENAFIYVQQVSFFAPQHVPGRQDPGNVSFYSPFKVVSGGGYIYVTNNSNEYRLIVNSSNEIINNGNTVYLTKGQLLHK